MSDRPILFSAPMVRALLAGTKTQTRRMLRNQDWPLGPRSVLDLALPGQRYAVGDRLWVREAWHGQSEWDHAKPSEMPVQYVRYTANECIAHSFGKGRPSIFMPRWASRITLTVNALKIERLQDISEEDAIAEGALRMTMDDDGRFYVSNTGTFRTGFAGIWAHINGPGSWDANPWVVALTFDVRKANIDA